MKRVEIEVMNPARALKAFEASWRSAERGEPATPRIAFGSLRELFSALTEKRLELMRHVAANEGLNIRRLAAALERDYKNVHGDVTALLELGLLEKDEAGGLYAPFDELVIHAGIRSAA